MSRLPLRVRLTLAFALAMAAVLAATGAFLYHQLGSSLDEVTDEALAVRLADASAFAGADDGGVGRGGVGGIVDAEDTFVQLLDEDGEVVAATRGAAAGTVLTDDERAPLAAGRVVRLTREELPGLDGRARLLATTVETPAGKRVVVVGASLDDRDEAVRELLGELLLAGPAALVLASLLGYGLASAALRPVEAMRAEAAAISGADPGRRLLVPTAKDEVGRLAETLNGMLQRLETALRRERAFVSDASHELRTPLARLRTELELALRRPRSERELEEALRSAACESDRLARLAEDLLVLARADEDGLPLRRAPVAARDVVTRVAERFAGEAGTAARAIAVEAAEGLGLAADAVRLEQALGNLVANALGHGRGTIRMTAAEHDGRVEFHVIDEGPGFPPQFVPRAFERFARADEARSGGGAGLGLAIVDVIAKAHGGSAHARNRAGGGADVWLSIPRA